MADPKKQYTVKIHEDIEKGVYANATSIHVNPNECILDMAVSLPNMPEPTLKVVSRVIMSHATAKSLVTVLSNALLDWQNKQKKSEEK